MKIIERTSYVSSEKTMKWVCGQVGKYNSKRWSIYVVDRRITLRLMDVDSNA